jgi:hypothetical protein
MPQDYELHLKPKLNSEVCRGYSGRIVVTNSDALSRIRMKTRLLIIIGTCAILVVSGVLTISWYENAYERIKEASILEGISRQTLQSGIPTTIQYTATERWFPTANSTPRQILETTYDFDPNWYFPNGTILGYGFDGWVNRLINENQQVYSNRALIEAAGNTVLTILISEAALLATASTLNLFARARDGEKKERLPNHFVQLVLEFSHARAMNLEESMK